MNPAIRRQLQCSFIVPIRRVKTDRIEIERLADYFKSLRLAGCEVLIVDGSPEAVFEEQKKSWQNFSRHFAPDPKYIYLNGKVNGVHTGVDLASCERIILADDDIRYSSADIKKMCDLLDVHEMVRPQNFIKPLPWWARIETARILINRGVLRAGDYPGTCGFRRSTMRRVGHYDGDVLFDNEEIVRHFALQGANIKYARDFFILKRPPSFTKWLEQRPRQAYEDFVMRAKTFAFLSVLPVVLASGFVSVRAAMSALIAISIVALLLCYRGLLSDQAYKFFPLSSPLYSPLWVFERSLSVYWALYWRIRYGGYPFG
ncbi:MAG: glycosyltransferase family 2 protein, partial [Acidobacteria bacterium]|nr:glycosyltransferase family 2 protein [Acidobacteriota bacterium]